MEPVDKSRQTTSTTSLIAASRAGRLLHAADPAVDLAREREQLGSKVAEHAVEPHLGIGGDDDLAAESPELQLFQVRLGDRLPEVLLALVARRPGRGVGGRADNRLDTLRFEGDVPIEHIVPDEDTLAGHAARRDSRGHSSSGAGGR